MTTSASYRTSGFRDERQRANRSAFATLRPGSMSAWLGGFNLLPWRQRRMARARRHRLYEWGAALALGCCCATAQTGWQAWQQTRLDAARGEVERSLASLRASLAEYGRLTREVAGQRRQTEAATIQSAPLTRLLDLFDALGSARADGIALQQVTHDARATLLQATVESETAADAWLARLHAVTDVQRVSIPELKRPDAPPHPASGVRGAQNAPLQMSVHLSWKETPAADASGGASKTGTSGIKKANGANMANSADGGANKTNGVNGTHELDGAKRTPTFTADHDASHDGGGAIR